MWRHWNWLFFSNTTTSVIFSVKEKWIFGVHGRVFPGIVPLRADRIKKYFLSIIRLPVIWFRDVRDELFFHGLPVLDVIRHVFFIFRRKKLGCAWTPQELLNISKVLRPFYTQNPWMKTILHPLKKQDLFSMDLQSQTQQKISVFAPASFVVEMFWYSSNSVALFVYMGWGPISV